MTAMLQMSSIMNNNIHSDQFHTRSSAVARIADRQ